MYYSDLPSAVKTKIIKWNKTILQTIKNKHQEKVEKYWTKLDSVIIDKDNSSYLVIELTEPEVVEEIKNRLKEKIKDIKDDLFRTDEQAIKLIEYTKDCDNVYWFYFICDILHIEFPNLELLYSDLREPLDQIFDIKYETPIKKVYRKKDNKEEIVLPNIDDILRIDITDVLDKLWIEYKASGDTIILYEDWQYTDWRRWNRSWNYITDFSFNGRAEGNPFAFVRDYLKLSDYETYIWFKDAFNL